MNKLTTSLFIILTVLFMACERNNDPQPAPSKYADAFPLKIGNYWIYQTTVKDPNNNVTIGQQLDSTWISKDTIVRGRQYFVQMSTFNWPLKTYITDSSGFIVTKILRFENIVFSRNNLADTLIKQGDFYRVMTNVDKDVTVPAGTFKTINSMALLKIDPADHSNHHQVPHFNERFLINEQLLFANRVGLVKRVSYHIGNTIEEDLVRYKVN